MTKKSPLEFYDEELSRTIRQIQQGLQDLEWPSAASAASEESTVATTTSPEDTLTTVDKLLTCSGVFLQQMEVTIRGLPSKEEKKQWKEILQFRKNTLSVLAADRVNVKLFQFPTMDSEGSGITNWLMILMIEIAFLGIAGWTGENVNE